MIRPRWPSQATLQPWPWQWRSRTFSSSPGASATPFRSEWPQLKRRTPLPKTTALDDHEFDEALAEELRRVGSTKEEFAARRGVKGRIGRGEVNWAALAADAGKIRQTELEGRHHRRRRTKHRHNRSTEEDDISAENIDQVDAESAATKKNMLLVRGVSPNLTASDFYRIAPNSLSSWESSIKKVQQRRHPQNFEPLGCYQVSFSTAEAAAAYHANLTRLQRLARHRLSSATGLWQATTPPHLHSPEGADPEADLDALTLAPASQPTLPVERARTSVRYPWGRSLSDLVEPLGYGPQPPVVLVKVFPGGLTATDLAHFIKQDGWQRDLAWKVSRPLTIKIKKEKPVPDEEVTSSASARQRITNKTKVDMTGSRFVIACETDWEARRFHRWWNQRTVSHTLENDTFWRYVISTSVINW